MPASLMLFAAGFDVTLPPIFLLRCFHAAPLDSCRQQAVDTSFQPAADRPTVFAEERYEAAEPMS